ncbi:TPA: hypothetical protein MJB77_16840 [Klebsiella pneumoniae]|uniref:hypothetical protein n=1 Tax=Klebsiella variicola TaxID=244366 RepID=UPI0024A6ADCA|nr:hypothetical protein [Klebsiella variicola]HBZ0628907.1 hypothetical protein [Klebsiella pneumoniae]WHE63568.1 hypothetical protein QLG20_04035 [Klebsiella variicola]HBW0854205.1 hypothetical protein [Klebsiella variicola]HBW0859312.1 hypothetical protein [Klebsiella variicola]HBW0865207.1 hypothetical protein [Klebsiella variicola]
MEKTTMSAASKTKNYDVVPTDVRRMTKLHTPAGDIKFTSLMKLIYAYIWTFQENENRGNDDPIHTNTDVIAWEMGVSEKALIAALMALDAAKVVIKGTENVRGPVNSSNYVAIPPASVVALGITPPKPGKRKAPKKSEEKHGNDNGHEEAAEAETPQTESANQPADTPAGQSANLASGSATPDVGQRDSVASNDDGNSDDGTDGDHAVSQEAQDDDPTFPPEKPEPEETAGRVMAPLDHLRYWSYVGDDGLCDYGVMWGVSGDGLDNLIGEHLKIREAEAEKNFKSQRVND